MPLVISWLTGIGGAMLMSSICNGYISYFRLDQERKKKKKKFLLSWLTGISGSFLGTTLSPMIYGSSMGCKANQVRNGPNSNPLAILVLESGFWRDLIKLCSIFFVCFADISSYYYSRGALCPNSYLTYTTHIILLW